MDAVAGKAALMRNWQPTPKLNACSRSKTGDGQAISIRLD